MAESKDPISRLSSLADSEDGIEQLFSPVGLKDIPDGKYVEPQYVTIQREEQLRAEAERKRLEAERKAQEQEEKRIKAEQKKAEKERALLISDTWHQLIESFLSKTDIIDFKKDIMVVHVHYIKSPVPWRIWNAIMMKDSLIEWFEKDSQLMETLHGNNAKDPNRIVSRNEMGDFINKLNQYTSGRITFDFIYKNETLKKELIERGSVINEDCLYVKKWEGKGPHENIPSSKARNQLIYDFTKNQGTFSMKNGFFFNKRAIQVRYVKSPIKGRIWNAVMKTGSSKYDRADAAEFMRPYKIKNFIELLNDYMSPIAVFGYIHEKESMNEVFETLGNDRFGVYLYFKEIDYAWISDV